VPHSNALHARLRDVGPYVVGPLARYSLNHDRLPPVARTAADNAGLGPICRNPFRSISSAPWRSWWRARRPCASSTAGPTVEHPRWMSHRGPGQVTGRLRRRAVCSTTVTNSPRTAACSTRECAADIAEPGQHRERHAGVRAEPAAPRHR
jgi:hypothetical protein